MRAAGGRTVLMDFGAGYDVKTDEAAGRRLAGTPLYLAPEVFDGEPRTARGDIYSVGVLLFHLATGHVPGRRADRRRRAPPAPGAACRAGCCATCGPSCPTPSSRWSNGRPRRRRSDRFQTAGELEAALNLALGHGSTQPETPPLPFRHKLAIAAGRHRGWWRVGCRLRPLGRGRRGAPDSRRRTRPSALPGPPSRWSTPVRGRRRQLPDRSGVLSRRGRPRRAAGARRPRGPRRSALAPGDQLGPDLRLRRQRGRPRRVVPALPAARPPGGEPAAGGHPARDSGHRRRQADLLDGLERRRPRALPRSSPAREPLSPAFQRVFDKLPRPSADAPVLARPLSTDSPACCAASAGWPRRRRRRRPGPARGVRRAAASRRGNRARRVGAPADARQPAAIDAVAGAASQFDVRPAPGRSAASIARDDAPRRDPDPRAAARPARVRSQHRSA